MGFVTCGNHPRQRCCWRCDQCPKCTPELGRLTKGDYCRGCVRELRAAGFVWSEHLQNYEPPTLKTETPSELFEAPFNLAGEVMTNEASAEGQARAKAEANHLQNKAQAELF